MLLKAAVDDAWAGLEFRYARSLCWMLNGVYHGGGVPVMHDAPDEPVNTTALHNSCFAIQHTHVRFMMRPKVVQRSEW